MKFAAAASSILLTSCVVCLSACGSIHLPSFTAVDQVPPDIKAQPRIVEAPRPLTGQEKWPRLGDVPTKPNDFSPQPVSDHYMNELEFDRDDAQSAQSRVEHAASPTAQQAPAVTNAPASQPALIPPQLPKE